MFVIPLMSDEENKSTEEELIAVRREKLNRLRELGVNPYGERFLIDKEISKMIENQYKRAIRILKENREKLSTLAALLLEKEVIFKDDLLKIFGERSFDKKEEKKVREKVTK